MGDPPPLVVCPDPNQYAPFVQGTSLDLLRVAAAGDAGLETIEGTLASAWYRAAFARSFPYLLAQAPGATLQGLDTYMPPAIEVAEDLLQLLARRLASRGVPLPQGVRVVLRSEVLELAKEIRPGVAHAKAHLKIPAEATWGMYLENAAFLDSLLASEWSAYTGLLFAYEDFAAGVVELRTGIWPKTTDLIGKGLLKQLGTIAHQTCWQDDSLRAAREVRNAIAHRGGRGLFDQWFKDLVDLGHIQVEAGFVLVTALETNALYVRLHQAALGLIKAHRGTPVT